MIYNIELEKGDGEGNLLLVAVVLFIKKLFLFNMRECFYSKFLVNNFAANCTFFGLCTVLQKYPNSLFSNKISVSDELSFSW